MIAEQSYFMFFRAIQLSFARDFTSYHPVLWKARTSNDASIDVFHTWDKYRQSRFALGEHPWRMWLEDAGVKCRSNRIQDKSHGIGIERNSVTKRLWFHKSRKFRAKRFSRWMPFTIHVFDLFFWDFYEKREFWSLSG